MLNIEFAKSVYIIKDIPKDVVPEIVLCGRSNVGKSTFINSLSKKNKIAKTSSSPGKTRSLNYYLVEKKFYFVDLPGYGYAKVPIKEKVKWQKLIKEYFYESKNISIAFHLIDSRHKPTSLDIIFNNLLKETNIPYLVMLSKCDKLNQSEREKSKKNVIQQFPELSFGDNLFLYSSTKGVGKKNVEMMLSKLFL
ncbi:MAG: ribosome biogenesis GTP-binding protein YihA/YsxC [Melioribacteraceae bacterium]